MWWRETPTSPHNGKCFRTSLRGRLIGRTSSQLRRWWCPRGHPWVWRGSSCPAEGPSVWWTEEGARLEPITHQRHFTGAFSCLFAVPGQHLSELRISSSVEVTYLNVRGRFHGRSHPVAVLSQLPC